MTTFLRVCADCEAETGALDRHDARKSHGLCQRHFVELLQQAGLEPEQISTAVNEMQPDGFCPDLGQAQQLELEAAR